MFKLRTWEEIETLYANSLIASYPDLKFTTESNMYKIMLPIMEEFQRYEQMIQSWIDKNNYLKAEGNDLDIYLFEKDFPRRKQSISKGFWTTRNSKPNTSALAYTIKFESNKGKTFVNSEPFTVDENGFAVIPIEAENIGSIYNIPVETINKIKTPVIGLISGTNEVPTTGGADLESDFEYRRRWERTRNAGSYWNTDGIFAEINNVNGVISSKVIENDSDNNITVGGVVMPSRSRRYYVDGGADIDIGKAIFKKTDRAIEETGDITVLVKDIQGDEREVKFSRPNYVKIKYKIVLDGYISTSDANKMIEKYIKDSSINKSLTSFEVVEQIRHSLNVTEVINLEVQFSRDNINYFSYLKLDVFEKGVI
ncbi:MAG: baseplate J/gp47 family protein [Cetobacterium sp.]